MGFDENSLRELDSGFSNTRIVGSVVGPASGDLYVLIKNSDNDEAIVARITSKYEIG